MILRGLQIDCFDLLPFPGFEQPLTGLDLKKMIASGDNNNKHVIFESCQRAFTFLDLEHVPLLSGRLPVNIPWQNHRCCLWKALRSHTSEIA